jgi:peroxiredoxin Q/BCP
MSNLLRVGQPAPKFTASNSQGKSVSLEDFAGQWLVLYFYPKDNTPGCTTEAQDFSQFLGQFQELGAQIVGVSPDSEKSHQKFIDKHKLSIELLSDPEHQIAETYGVWGLKKFMGKEYMGIIRSTFLLAPDGKMAQVWSPVKVKGHAETVLNQLKDLIKGSQPKMNY